MKRKNKTLLVPELVPAPLWGKSVHKMLGSKSIWKKEIRVNALASANNFCSICKSPDKRMTCHEKWDYNDNQSTATLLGFEMHCPNCDLVTHAGRAFKLGYVNIVISHLCVINNWDGEQAAVAIKKAMDIWIGRNKKNWKVKVATSLINQYPALARLPEFIPPAISYKNEI